MNRVQQVVQGWFKKDSFIRTCVILVLVIVAVLESSVVIRDFDATRALGGLKPADRINRHSTHIPIEPWMTFGYINSLLELPPEYMRDLFGVTEAKYPNIELRRYAKDHKIDPVQLVREINQAITDYQER